MKKKMDFYFNLDIKTCVVHRIIIVLITTSKMKRRFLLLQNSLE